MGHCHLGMADLLPFLLVLETCRDLGFLEKEDVACLPAFSPVVLILRLLASATHPFLLSLFSSSSFFPLLLAAVTMSAHCYTAL